VSCKKRAPVWCHVTSTRPCLICNTGFLAAVARSTCHSSRSIFFTMLECRQCSLSVILILLIIVGDTCVPRQGLKGSTPPLNLQHFLYCVFAKYTFQALLLYSLYPKFYIGKRYKLYNNFTFCFSFWGTKSPMTLTGVLPLDLTGGLPSPRLPGLAPTTRTLSIVKSWLRLR